MEVGNHSGSANTTEIEMVEDRERDPETNRVVSHSCGEGRCKALTSNYGEASKRNLMTALVASVIFMTVEIVVGIKANSLAIRSDALHVLTDVVAFAISVFSVWASGWKATPGKTYGFLRIETLGALVSILIIWLTAGILIYEAIERLKNGNPGEVKGSLMFIVSTVGLVLNIAMAVLLGHDHNHGNSHGDHHHNEDHDDDDHTDNNGTHHNRRNMNLHGAYLHVLGDIIQSIGVMVTAVVIWAKPEWKIADLICTLVFSIVVLATTIGMLRKIVGVLMESTPRGIDTLKLEKALCELDAVVACHELHIWCITPGKSLLTCHLIVNQEANSYRVLENAINYIKTEYNITHVTIQIEPQQLASQ
ncbi:metal tolerance protein A2-like [Rosa rugosa]|uniref:metal tolerance protein A2-like n=1 Tax=Rosa rugosa TaxID=74645 RepID=UPI002B40349D|nr:metal tolerance protein A2-like [Rosa rugosa]